LCRERAAERPQDFDSAAQFAGAASQPFRDTRPLLQAEGQALLSVLEANRWHLTRVAEHLGISRNTLYRKLRKHGIARGV
jgi:transcriptional regulator of acetoin/glycerol metabolism